MSSKPAHSFLFVPCDKPRALDKARSLSPHSLIFDLEDAVGPNHHAEALRALDHALRQGGFSAQQKLIRLSQASKEQETMVGALLKDRLVDGLVIPKVRKPEDLSLGWEDKEVVPLFAMVETPACLLRLDAICAFGVTQGLKGLIFGPNDFLGEMRILKSPERLEQSHALTQIVLCARTHGLMAIDGVYNHFQDETGFIKDAQIGLSFGFDAKSLIHPAQIAPCEALFGRGLMDKAWARAVVAAFAANPDAGALAIDGEMVERLHLVAAQDCLKRD